MSNFQVRINCRCPYKSSTSAGFWPKATLASTIGRLSGVSVQTWTPTLTPASSDMDANFSDLHALQSQKIREQGMASIGGMSPNGSKAV
ncbi:hypothetical protein Taro_010977 [Colocasia esculenta]|uniref:Uncharacterized protein n=1 Tax=Colocasia esculenta TaxID=4460 RepID=A0A843U9Q2_COLES|nr:hypothetical protein [Colocasia esculenta]